MEEAFFDDVANAPAVFEIFGKGKMPMWKATQLQLNFLVKFRAYYMSMYMYLLVRVGSREYIDIHYYM